MIVEPPRPSASRIPAPPSLAVRAAFLGMLAFVIFAAIFFRLWYLQILSGNQYVQRAQANSLREVPIAAPRGQILDSEGKPLAGDRIVNAVQVNPAALPKSVAARTEVFAALAGVLGMHRRHIEELVRRRSSAVSYAPVTIATDAGRRALTLLSEHQGELPGVEQRPQWVRTYPYGQLAAQALGYVGPVNEAELTKQRSFRGIAPDSIVGQAGLEHYFEPYLRGRAGQQRIEVNANNEAVGAGLPAIAPQRGENVQTSLDLPLQQAGERALRESIAHADALGKGADAGAFTAIDPLSGEVLAIGSYPGFDPQAFTHPLTDSEYRALVGSGNGQPSPVLDNATAGLFPAGSSFKPITAIAALEGGFISSSESFGPGPCIHLGAVKFCNAGNEAFPPMNLTEALKVSSDTYFFTVGERAFQHEGAIQSMARRLGIGQETGIELNEAEGVLPDARWRAQMNRLQRKCEGKYGNQASRYCGFVSEVKEWTVGEEMDLAVGQGSLQATPLQLAVAYSTLVNAWRNNGAGWRVRPHLGVTITAPSGKLLRRLPAPPVARVRLNPESLAPVFEGIHQATTQPGGTSTLTWQGWNQAAHATYGKTGTAEVAGKTEDSWYACYVADAKRPIVITVVVQHGGFGEEAAAPVARVLAQRWFYGKAGQIKTINPSEAAR